MYSPLRSGLLWAVVTSTALAAIVACSSTETSYVEDPVPDDEDASRGGTDAKTGPQTGLGELRFQPERAYSGFDGTHTFIVPVAVYDAADDLEVTATKPSAVTIAPKALKSPTRSDGTSDNGRYFFVTVKEAGTVTLVAKSEGRTAEATLTVHAYPPTRWQTGETRYKNGGGGDPPCTQCHVNGEAIDHSPAALATATDDKIGVVITTGISTAGFPIEIDGRPGHRWKVTEAEREGLVAYLRSLEPNGFK